LIYLQIIIIFSDSNNTKFVLDRINQAEKYLGSICVNVGKICRKEARLRDCNDELVQNMFEFADREKINTSLRQSLQQYASYLSAVEDYRNTLVRFKTSKIKKHI
jgi:cell shape-determining protein MreC